MPSYWKNLGLVAQSCLNLVSDFCKAPSHSQVKASKFAAWKQYLYTVYRISNTDRKHGACSFLNNQFLKN